MVHCSFPAYQSTVKSEAWDAIAQSSAAHAPALVSIGIKRKALRAV